MVMVKKLELYLVLIIWTYSGQSDGVLSIICFRHPNSALCQKNSLQNFFKNTSQLIPSISPPVKFPSSPPSSSSLSSSEAENYCNSYQPHFLYYCTGSNQNSQADEFCQFYPTKCDTKSIPLRLGSEDDIKSQCSQYKVQADQFCNGNEEPSIKILCDKYRRYCTSNDDDSIPPRNPLIDSGPQLLPLAEPSPLPAKFLETIPGEQTNAGSGTGTGNYCNDYMDKYQTVCLGAQQRRDDSPAKAQRFAKICQLDASLVNSHCKEKTKMSANAQAYCEYYFNKCPKNEQKLSTQNQFGSDLSPSFCNDFHNQCFDLAAITRNQICNEFAYLKDTYCPGHEFAHDRIGCNKYRIYCQNLLPMKDIDGGLARIV